MTTRLAVVAILAMAVPLAAQDARRAERLIEELGDDDPGTRDAAVAELKKLGRDALPAVEKALIRAAGAEVKGRLRDLLGYLKVPPGGGAVQDGLKVVLSTDRKEIRAGEDIPFRVTVWNLTEAPRLLYVGYSTGGIYFESGWAFAITAPGEEAARAPRWHVGFCGTGAGPLYTTVPPHGSQTFETVATYRESSEKLGLGPHYTFRKRDWLSIEAPQGKVHRFRIRHAVMPDEAAAAQERFLGLEPPDPSAAPWTGTLVSNEVDLRFAEGP